MYLEDDFNMYSELGDKVKLLRKILGLKQDDLDEVLQLSKGQISKLESKRRNLSLKQLEKLCNYFKVNISYFFMSTTTDVCLDLIEKARALFEIKYLTSDHKEDLFTSIMKIYIQIQKINNQERNDFVAQHKMHLINKIFNNDTIRVVQDKEDEKYFISVVDIVEVLSGSKDDRKYWNKLKQRLKKEKNKTVTNCHQLKLIVQAGKYRLTDVTDIEVMFKIIESILSKNVDKKWITRYSN